MVYIACRLTVPLLFLYNGQRGKLCWLTTYSKMNCQKLIQENKTFLKKSCTTYSEWNTI